MKKLEIIALIIVVVLFISISEGKEKALFLDSTSSQVFTPLYSFLERSSRWEWVEAPSNSEENSSLSELQDEDVLLFRGYEKEDLLFFEVIDLQTSNKILGLVRKKEDQNYMIEELKEKLAQEFSFHREIKILFVREEYGKSSIILSDIEGKKQIPIYTTEEGYIESPILSFDTRYVIFVWDKGWGKGIYRLNLENKKVEELSVAGFNDYSPTISSRDQIVFVSERKNKPSILKMNKDGSSQKPFIEKDNPLNWPAFSPDSRSLAYCELIDGKWSLKLYDFLTQEEETFDFPLNVKQPVFTPSGGRLIFVGEEKGRGDLYSLDLVNQNLTRLTYDNYPKEKPAPSPDGRWVAFSGAAEGNNWDIFLLDMNKGTVNRFTSSWSRETHPYFSPSPVY
ncbi:MAG: TolB protein [Candidatus Atribacteria bacterium]|nr:TolB protein [Candidatus Atribacteria bacterium]